MNKSENAMREILESGEAIEFLKQETIEEMYEFVFKKDNSITEEEFDKYVAEIIEAYTSVEKEDNLEKAKLNEDDIQNIAGGRNKRVWKGISSALSALMMVPVANLPVGATQGLQTETSVVSKVKSGFNKGFKRVSELLERNPWIKPLICSIVVAAVGMGAYKGYKSYKKSQEEKEKNHQQEVYKGHDEGARFAEDQQIYAVENAIKLVDKDGKVITYSETMKKVLDQSRDLIKNDKEIERLMRDVGKTNDAIGEIQRDDISGYIAKSRSEEEKKYYKARMEFLKASIELRRRKIEASVADDLYGGYFNSGLVSSVKIDDNNRDTLKDATDVITETSVRVTRADTKVRKAREKMERYKEKYQSLIEKGSEIEIEATDKIFREIKDDNQQLRQNIENQKKKVEELRTEREELSEELTDNPESETLKAKLEIAEASLSLNEAMLEEDKARFAHNRINEQLVAIGNKSSNAQQALWKVMDVGLLPVYGSVEAEALFGDAVSPMLRNYQNRMRRQLSRGYKRISEKKERMEKELLKAKLRVTKAEKDKEEKSVKMNNLTAALKEQLLANKTGLAKETNSSNAPRAEVPDSPATAQSALGAPRAEVPNSPSDTPSALNSERPANPPNPSDVPSALDAPRAEVPNSPAHVSSALNSARPANQAESSGAPATIEQQSIDMQQRQ